MLAALDLSSCHTPAPPSLGPIDTVFTKCSDALMATGEGKGWSRGRTAANDPRVARAAAGHRGQKYVRRTPWSDLKWARSTYTSLPIEWSAEMAYIVGLTATDGCLASNSRAITFKSADRQLVETYRDLLGRSNKIGAERTSSGGTVYRVQFKDTRLHAWFQTVGLTPRKSLTLGAIDVPDKFLGPLVRGLLEGDGSISNAVWKADTSRRSDYYYEWLRTRFVSASPPHLEWLKARLHDQLNLRGWIWQDLSSGNCIGCLSYGKHDSIKLLRWLYTDPDAACLLRKRAIWDNYVYRHPSWVRDGPTTIYA
jgi:hypothetical protein